MSTTRLLLAAVLVTALLGIGAPVSAQTDPEDPEVTERKSTVGKMKTHPVGSKKSKGTVSVDTGDSRTTDGEAAAPAKKKPKKKTGAKKKAKKKAEPKVRPYGLGLKIGVLPYNTMSSLRTDASGRTEYDMAFAWGWGAAGQYRLLRNFYLTGEIMYWYTRVQGRPENYPKESEKYEVREDDGLLNMGVGLRFNVYGGEHSSDRIFLLGKVGFTDYIADDANPDGTNRAGMYVGGGVGYEHAFAELLSVFADTGIYYNGFMATSSDESEAAMWYWGATAGFLFHFDKN
ncbi:MAG: hypothetical protein FJ109_04620 [Deltaproteobacteria bacterium]|nr:hypothetical protein [Deltaproteobacteria bacterium]